MAQISESLWFENQHPSIIDEYNDPNTSMHLSQSCRYFELTLNNDLGSQYVETHQLAIPPVQFASEDDLARLSQVVAYQYTLKAKEYQEGEEIVEGIIMKAQILLQCAHDALTEVGLERIGCLFGAPLDVRLADSEQAVVEGWRLEEPVNLSVDSADVRQLFMHRDAIGDVTWLYPAPDERTTDEPQKDEPVRCSAVSVIKPAPLDSGDDLRFSTTATSSPVSPCGIVTSRTGNFMPPLALSASVSPTHGMKRVDSWMNDKFTAQPTRSHFPPLSDQNFLLADATDGATPEPDVAHDVAPCTSVQSTLQVSSAEDSQLAANLPKPGSFFRSVQDADTTSHQSTEPARRDSGAVAPHSQRSKTAGKACTADVGATRTPSHTACITLSQSETDSLTARPQGVEDVMTEAGIHRNGSCWAPGTCACGACSTMPSDLCRIHPEKQGILVRPDDGLRSSVRQVLVERLAPLLVCHLNRFQKAVTGTHKNALHVSFPFHMFIHPDIAGSSSGVGIDPDDAVRYRLKAVIEHHGRNMSGGHYTCYAWRPSACATVAADLANALWTHGRSEPVPVLKHGAFGKRKVRKDTRRIGPVPSVASPKLGMSNESMQLSHGESFHSGDVLLHSHGHGVDAGSMGLSTGQESIRSEERPTAAGLLCEGVGELDWEEIADHQEMQSAGLKSNNLHALHVKGEASDCVDMLAMQTGFESLSIHASRGKADESLHIGMSVDQEHDVGIWVKCDDERIEEVPWQTVSSAQAYMLMYEKVL